MSDETLLNMLEEYGKTDDFLNEHLYGYKPPSTETREKGIKDERSFKRMPKADHVYYKPGMYIGGDGSALKPVKLFRDKKLHNTEMIMCDGIVRFFYEILSNASDNARESVTHGINPGVIKVTMDNENISVYSEGQAFPVNFFIDEDHPTGILHDENGKPITIAQETFSNFGVGTNLDEDMENTGAGTNGLGAKLTNVYSRIFEIGVSDGDRGRTQMLRWTHNMKRLDENKISAVVKYNGDVPYFENKGKKVDKSFVKVTYRLDFRKFFVKDQSLIHGYNEDYFALFEAIAIGSSLANKIPVYFNDRKYDMSNINNYVKLILDSKAKSKHFTLDSQNQDEKDKQKIEVYFFDTPGKSTITAFTNGLANIHGGVHVKYVYDKLTEQLIKEFFPKKQGERTKITSKEIKESISAIIIYDCVNPTFVGQMKEILEGPEPKFKFTNIAKDFKDWEAIKYIRSIFDFKNKVLIPDGVKTRRVNVLELKNANKAGTKESIKCSLYGGEGTSALGYIKSRILGMGGYDYWGYMSFTGKIPNVKNIRDDPNNEESVNAGFKKVMKSIKTALGLKDEADYTTEADRNDLRYGQFIIAVDADEDGKHIACLIINLFIEFFPTFIKAGMLSILLTPCVRIVKKGNFDGDDETTHRFYTELEFNRWIKNNQVPRGSIVKYCKGLGSSNKKEDNDDIPHCYTVILNYDDRAETMVDMAFSRFRVEDRKDWILRLGPIIKNDDSLAKTDILDEKRLLASRDVSNVVENDLAEYAIHSLKRSIPSYRDGLKDSQRKMLYFALDMFKYKATEKAKKVGELANECITPMKYHHGPTSMEELIKLMATDYVGSNNLNILFPDGNFGSRAGTRGKGGSIGKDAGSSRYISTRLMKYCEFLFDKKLVDLVEREKSEGVETCSKWIPCCVPLHFCNGLNGIATGWSVFLPSYNPIEVIDNIMNYFSTEKVKPMIPYYRGFTGDIYASDKTQVEGQDEFKTNDESEENETYQGLSMKTAGKFIVKKEIKNPDNTYEYDIDIVELPIGVGGEKYFEWLESLIGRKKSDLPEGCILSIKDVLDNTVKNKKSNYPAEFVKFSIVSMKTNKKITRNEDLRLVKGFSLNNINLLDDNDVPVKFTVASALENYIISMLNLYDFYIDKEKEVIKNKIFMLEKKLLLANDINNEVIIVFGNNAMSDEEIKDYLEENKIPFEIYDKIGLKEVKKTDKIENDIVKLNEELNVWKKETAENLWSIELVKLKNYLKKSNKELF